MIFCWGDDNNSADNIRLLKNLGMHAIIYDKMDTLSTKEKKVSDVYDLDEFLRIQGELKKGE